MGKHFIIKGMIFLTLIIFIWNTVPVWAEGEGDSQSPAPAAPQVSAQSARCV